MSKMKDHFLRREERLAKAAPGLLAALEDSLALIERWAEMVDWDAASRRVAKKARAAVKKAKERA